MEAKEDQACEDKPEAERIAMGAEQLGKGGNGKLPQECGRTTGAESALARAENPTTRSRRLQQEEAR